MMRLALAMTIALSTTPAAGGMQGVPPLPRLDLAAFPAPAREAVAPAAANAAAHPDDPAAVGQLGRVLHAWEQYEAAHQAYARAGGLAPATFEWHYLDGIVLQRLTRHAEAAAALTRAVAANREYLPARLALADALFDAGDLDGSRAQLEALARDPRAEPRVAFGLGRIDAARGRHAEAIAHLQRAVALFPEWGAAYYALAQSFRATGRRDEALAALEQHARYGPRWPGVPDPVLAAVLAVRDDAAASLHRGLEQAAAGDLAGAVASHEAALRRDPDLAQAHANLVSLYGRLRNWDKAAEHYRATVALGFNLAEAHYDYAVILGMQSRWEEAEATYRKAIAVNPLQAEARNNLGQLLERRRDFEGATAEYRDAVDAKPSFRLARFNLGRMLIGLNRPGEAVAVLEPLQQPRDAETPRYLFALATAHARLGHREQALAYATTARQMAIDFKQPDLAQAIEQDLGLLK